MVTCKPLSWGWREFGVTKCILPSVRYFHASHFLVNTVVCINNQPTPTPVCVCVCVSVLLSGGISISSCHLAVYLSVAVVLIADWPSLFHLAAVTGTSAALGATRSLNRSCLFYLWPPLASLLPPGGIVSAARSHRSRAHWGRMSKEPMLWFNDRLRGGVNPTRWR